MFGIRLHQTGGPDVLRWESVELPPPAPGEARVRHTAIGLNFIDTYHRTGLYPLPLPATLGSEAAGIVEAIGEGVDEVAVGDRVAYGTGPSGSYAEARNMPASFLVKLPQGVDDQVAAATMLKGMTAHYLLEIGHLRARKQTIVVHAAAGGVGLLLCQWAKHVGATVIGTVGTEAKAKLARAGGCDYVLVGVQAGDLPRKIEALTKGTKADVVYDSVGKDTFSASMQCLRPRGMLVSFGQSSGAVPPFDLRTLSTSGSLFLTRPTLGHYTRTREELTLRASELFEAIRTGVLEVRVAQTYPLREAAAAHRDLEARKTTGSTVLLP
jgi:NADPH2:quinone reductase